MAQLGDTVVTGSLAVSNCIYGSVTCATTATNACKGWNGSAFASFGSNAFNSTSFTTCTGTVTAITVSVNGVSATSASGCATASISLTNVPATSACCAKQICRCGYTSAYDFDVALVNGCSSVSDAYIYASCSCRLKFCSCKGELKITDCNGCLGGYMSATVLSSTYVVTNRVLSDYIVVTCNIASAHTLGKTSTSGDVVIDVYCGTCSSSCDTYFTFCGCDGRMHGSICGNISHVNTHAECTSIRDVLLTDSHGDEKNAGLYVSCGYSLLFDTRCGILATNKLHGVLNASTPSSPENGDIWIA